MDNIKIDRLDELEKHVELLVATPETLIDAKLFDDVELQLTPTSTSALIPHLLEPLTHILLTTPHDPTVPASFITKLLQPLKLIDILQLANESTLTLALESSSPAVNLLALNILSKARTPSDVAILSIMQPFILQLIKTWLSAPSVDVGHRATEVLAELLELDSPNRAAGTLNFEINGGKSELRAEPTGQGLLWRRIFGDSEIYASIFELCSGGGEPALDERQMSLAQARLLRLLPRLACLDIEALKLPVPVSELRESSNLERLRGSEYGILYWASTGMIDRSDILMHVTLLDYFADLLKRLGGFGDFERVELKQAQMDFFVEMSKDLVKQDPAVGHLIVELNALAEDGEGEEERQGAGWKDFIDNIKRKCVPSNLPSGGGEGTVELLREREDDM